MKKTHPYACGTLVASLSAVLTCHTPLLAQSGAGPRPAPPSRSNGNAGRPDGPHDRNSPDNPDGPGGPGGPRGARPPRIEGPNLQDLTQVLRLTADQQQQIKKILDTTQNQIDATLTTAQRAKLRQLRAQHGPPPSGPDDPNRPDGPPGGPDGPDGAPGGPPDRNGPPPPERQSEATQQPLQDEDHGRPVALVARDLGVTPEQFRAAFKKVHPAGAGQHPTQAQRQANRKVLSETLGVAPERLDAVMDKYRPGGRGDNGPEQPQPATPPQ